MNRLIDNRRLEWFALCMFVVFYVIISIYHEPWFDEAQSWQIAKCASFKEILLDIPHYEGHPPLWWLILAVPAKIGVPFEIGLKTIGFLITISSVFLILFYSPYPCLMRVILPFSYFVFYQYGIIVRPYSLMMLTFIIMVITFPQKDQHPWRFTGLLILLCLTSAYGIVLAGGIALCMVWDLIAEKGIKGFFADLFQDRRLIPLWALLFVAILLVIEMMPRSNTFIVSKNARNGFLLCFICALFTFIGECTLTTSSWFRIDRVLLQHVNISRTELALMCLIGCLLWILIIGVSSKKKLKYIFVPYVLLSFFASTVYFSVHHVGVVLLLLLFWTGIVFQDKDRFEIGRIIINKITKTNKEKKWLKKTAVLICILCLLVPTYWCIRSAIFEIEDEYSYGRYASSFLRDYNLENCRIFSIWGNSSSDSDIEDDTALRYNTYYVGTPVLINAYFDHNICFNLNCGKDSEAYMHYQVATPREDEENITTWRNAGVPDIILGKANINQVYYNISYEDYMLVDAFPINYIWKDVENKMTIPVFARKEIMEEYGLEPTKDEVLLYKMEGLSITDEMREQYLNGVPIEEIIKPYLDAIFGEAK